MSDTIDVEVRPAETGLAAPMGGDLAFKTPEQADREIEALRQSVDAHKRMLAVGLGLLTEADFKRFGDNNHLLAAGAQRLLVLGIHLSEPKLDIEKIGDDVIVTCTLKAEWPRFNQSLTELGICSTRDKFYFDADTNNRTQFAKYLQQAEDNRELAMQLLLGDVKKKAYANAQGRVVSGILGIRNWTMEQLKAAGLNTGQIAAGAVNFRTGATKETARKSQKAMKHVPMDGLANLAVGSKVATVGTLIGVQTKQGAKGDYYKLEFAGGVHMTYFGKSAPEYEDGSQIAVHVQVKDYDGRKYFQAEHIEMAE